jgi:hypothetical protein
LAAMDKVVYYFSPKVSLVFGWKHEVIWKSKSMCTGPEVTTRHGYIQYVFLMLSSEWTYGFTASASSVTKDMCDKFFTSSLKSVTWQEISVHVLQCLVSLKFLYLCREFVEGACIWLQGVIH